MRVALLFACLACFGLSLEVTCTKNGDCTNDQSFVNYTCSTNNGDCYCGNADICTCDNNNGGCHCQGSRSCQCNSNNGACNCGLASTCDCGNLNGNCCAMPSATVTGSSYFFTSSVTRDSTGCYTAALSGGAIAGIVLGSIFGPLCLCCLCWYFCCAGPRQQEVPVVVRQGTTTHVTVVNSHAPQQAQPVMMVQQAQPVMMMQMGQQPNNGMQMGYATQYPQGGQQYSTMTDQPYPQQGYAPQQQYSPQGYSQQQQPGYSQQQNTAENYGRAGPPGYESATGVLCPQCKMPNPAGSAYCLKCGIRG